MNLKTGAYHDPPCADWEGEYSDLDMGPQGRARHAAGHIVPDHPSDALTAPHLHQETPSQMKQLTAYQKNGYEFLLVEREGPFAIFLGTKPGSEATNFEVIKIQSHQGRDFHGTWYEPAEFPPSDVHWGTHGFTFSTLSAARVKWHHLIEAAAKPKS